MFTLHPLIQPSYSICPTWNLLNILARQQSLTAHLLGFLHTLTRAQYQHARGGIKQELLSAVKQFWGTARPQLILDALPMMLKPQ